MTLLYQEGPLVFSKTVAQQLGLNEAIFLQQLHFKLHHSVLQKEGHIWIYRTLGEWHKEFPFWSQATIKRIIQKLEKQQFIFSSNQYNKMRIDRTKWYRLNYEQFYRSIGQSAPIEDTTRADPKKQSELKEQPMLTPTITKELQENQEDDGITFIIHYLNQQTGKQFNPTDLSTRQLIRTQFSAGKTVEQLKQVIDLKMKEWGENPKMARYLRSSTLFHPRNIDRYIEEARSLQGPKITENPFFKGLQFEVGES